MIKPKRELGNDFAVVGRAKKALCKAGMADKAEEMKNRINKCCFNYEEVLLVIKEYVEVVHEECTVDRI